MSDTLNNRDASKPGFIGQRLYLHMAVVGLFLATMIVVSAWTGNTLTMITAIARFERTHTVSRLEAKVSLLEYIDMGNPQAKASFYENMAITQSYNKVFSELLVMRTTKTDKEFAQIIENTFKEADHKTAVIIVNRIKALYWHPIIKELVSYASGANRAGEMIVTLAPLAMDADNVETQHAVLRKIEDAEKDFRFNERSFSRRCSDLSNEIATFVDYVSIAILIVSVGFTGMITYLVARFYVQQTVEHASELEKSRKQYFNLVEGTPDLIIRVDVEGCILFVNHAALGIFGLTPEECIGRMAFDFIHPDDRDATIAAFQSWLKSDEGVFSFENRQVGIDGQEHLMAWSINAERDENRNVTALAGSARDITERRRADDEKEKLKSQLNQAQKMEYIGRLAGGVAHDFNNMLGVILGNTEMVLETVAPDSPLHDELMEIKSAAHRSADLTRQLLAFARKQTVAPRVIDLNETVEGMLKMLRRLIGEDIDLAWIPGKDLWPVKMDPGQLDQLLANLCVNARDSIVDVGKVTIETTAVTFDEAYCEEHVGFNPGDYLLLSVSDNGCGMDHETQSHLFEPFFTTKEMGKGTGLGLATVYGIVKQNNGFITVYSEVNLGTTFRIYLSRYTGDVDQNRKAEPDTPDATGNETILIVEDEASILKMARMMLEHYGYTVLASSSATEAIRMAEDHAGGIDLLITDVVMPEMNGRDLLKSMMPFNPDLKCLFMSGYTANVIAHHGVLDADVNFIQKPFSKKDLAAKVREALDH